MSSTDTIGHFDVRGLSVTDPRLRQWISVHTMSKDVGMLSQLVGLVTAPNMFVSGNKPMPIGNDGLA